MNLKFNEIADSLAKRARNQDKPATPTSLADANAYVKSKVITPPKIELKRQITQLNIHRKTTTTITMG